MKTKIIKTEEECNLACERIYSLINSTSEAIESESKESEELEFLSLLVETYEKEHYFINAPNPIEAIKFRMEQMNLIQADIAPLFGGKTRVSEVLNGKRPLTLKTITLLNKYLGIPLESLILNTESVKLEPITEEELFRNKAIREYVLSL